MYYIYYTNIYIYGIQNINIPSNIGIQIEDIIVLTKIHRYQCKIVTYINISHFYLF